jgi:hypothetical protein
LRGRRRRRRKKRRRKRRRKKRRRRKRRRKKKKDHKVSMTVNKWRNTKTTKALTKKKDYCKHYMKPQLLLNWWKEQKTRNKREVVEMMRPEGLK